MTATAKTNKESIKGDPIIKEIEVDFPGYFLNSKKTAAPAPAENNDDKNEGKSTKTTKTLTTTTFNLSGTLRLPSSSSSSSNNDDVDNTTNKYPAALIIHGSGPIDRDGNAIMGFPIPSMKLNTQNRLAEALVLSPLVVDDDNDAEEEEEGKSQTKPPQQEQKEGGGGGMAVLCYDKRGIGKSISPQNKDLYYEAGMMDLVNDAIQAYKFLVDHPSIDSTRIVLIGHSEGAILLPLIAEEMKRKVSPSSLLPPPQGLIFLAGFGETLDGAARNQRERMVKEVSEETGLQGFILRRVVTKEKLDKQHADYMEQVKSDQQDYIKMYCGLVKVPAKWYREHLEWDATACLANCNGNILAITGGKDVQVDPQNCTPDNAKELAPNATSLQTHIIPNMTHILRSIDGKPKIMNIQKEYPKLGMQPLDDELLHIIRKWLKENNNK